MFHCRTNRKASWFQQTESCLFSNSLCVECAARAFRIPFEKKLKLTYFINIILQRGNKSFEQNRIIININSLIKEGPIELRLFIIEFNVIFMVLKHGNNVASIVNFQCIRCVDESRYFRQID